MRNVTYCVIDSKDNELLDIGNFNIEDDILIDGIRKLVSQKVVKPFYDDEDIKRDLTAFLNCCFPMNDQSETIGYGNNIYHIKVQTIQKY